MSLLALLKVNNDVKYTIPELSELININFNYNPLNKWLQDEGMLMNAGTKTVIRDIKGGDREFHCQSFKVNHKMIEQFLCAELPTKIMYDRILSGKTQVIPKLTPRI